MRAPKPPSLTTKELSKKTWPDFERLFSQGNGWDFCWCMHFHRLSSLPQKEFRTRAERSVRNHKDKKGLVEQNRSHGILVYSKGEPIGWCQFGPKDELPRIDQGRKYQELENDSDPLWRITCFVVDKKHRKRGVGSAALNAALEAIRKKGGGVVEGYPLIPEQATSGTYSDMITHGTISMFKKAGFKTVAPYGETSVLMRRAVS